MRCCRKVLHIPSELIHRQGSSSHGDFSTVERQLLLGVFKLRAEFGDLVVERDTLGHQGRDLLVCIEDCRMISIPENAGDLGKGEVCEFAAEIHCDVSGDGVLLRAG